MPLKPPVKGTHTVDVHVHPDTPPHGNASRPALGTRAGFDSSTSFGHPSHPGRMFAEPDPDAIRLAPTVTVHRAISPVATRSPDLQPLEHYWLTASARLPDADAEGFRTHKGRRYVDVPKGGIVLVGVDPDTGLPRARLAGELVASGPILIRDTDSGLWHPSNDADVFAAPLTEASLQAFRTELDFTAVEPDSDGMFNHHGKRYVVIDNHAYQAMLDPDASTPGQKVWRIVNSNDPVASDPANLYRSSRSGVSRAITRNEENNWVLVSTGLRGGMRRRDLIQANMAILMQRYEPFQQAHAALSESSERYNTLWGQARPLPDGSAEKNAALVAVEVHLLRHIKKQTDFVQSMIDARDWLPLVKATGLYKQELLTFQIERVEYLNRLMAVMDLRIRPTASGLDAENCKKIITHMNKKLKLLDDRQAVMEQIRKTDPGAAPELLELSQQVPGTERINFNKLTLYVHLFADTPEHSPSMTMHSLGAIDLITGDLKNVPEREHPMALVLAFDQIRHDRYRFETLLASDHPKAQYIKEIIALIEPIEKRIENRLTEIYETYERNNELPSLDQDIDFDFIPPQPVDTETDRPASSRKMFRTRQHGTYRVLVGDTETAVDGSVTIKVPDVLRPEAPPKHYEKRQGEWLPVRPAIAKKPRHQLINKANRLLTGVDKHLAEARMRELKKDNPTEILEDLGTATDKLVEQARRLENHETTAGDMEIQGLVDRLRTAADTLTRQGQTVLVRMYKNREVLDLMRVNYLMDQAELTVSKTVDRKPLGKGRSKSFLDVYSIRDRASGAPLWEAHFHYDDTASLSFKVDGGHLKTLEQGRRGIESQRRDEQAGLPHVKIWRATFDGKTASKIFTLANEVAVPPE
ncbi:hypothetical protein [Pseudomonas sp. B33.4]|uniref:hypothetical protein n=1 Tax=Pseudomonas sp. B33.4 TaxID=3104265 RepID=UPI002ADEE0F0|nr:hypothetical protein [Pseudomonas sp. B33.4]